MVIKYLSAFRGVPRLDLIYCLFHPTVETARALLDYPAPHCFQYMVANPQYSLSNESKTQAATAQECQAICRNMPGCQIFQWMPKVWKESGQCRLKTMKPKWTQHEWYLLPNAISGPPICTRKMIN